MLCSHAYCFSKEGSICNRFVCLALQRASGKPEDSVVSMLPHFTSAAVIGLLWWLQPKAHSYDKVLGDSLLFYEAHRSGVSLRPPHGGGT